MVIRSRKQKKCKNCGTYDIDNGSRGFCGKCYRLILKREQVYKWVFSDVRTLKGYPTDQQCHNPKYFEMIKDACIAKAGDILRSIKMREIIRNGSVDGLDIESESTPQQSCWVFQDAFINFER